jgi:hypothetical protein
MTYDSDEHDDDHNHDHSMANPVLIAFTLIDLALNPKAAKAGLKQLVKLNKDIGIAEEKFVNLQSQAAEIETALTARVAAIDARAAEIERRETSFEASMEEARDHLRAYYDRIIEADRHIRYRVLSHADLLHGYNAALQDLPDWPAIRRLVVGLLPIRRRSSVMCLIRVSTLFRTRSPTRTPIAMAHRLCPVRL